MFKFITIVLLLSSSVSAGSKNRQRPAPPVTAVEIAEQPPKLAIGITEREYIELPSTEIVDDTLKYYSIPFVSCASYCDSITGCVSYVEESSRHFNCWFKSSQNFRNNNERSTFILKKPVRQYTKQNSVDYGANDIVVFKGSMNDCAVACDAVNDCVGYSMAIDGASSCYLKRKMNPSGMVFKDQVVSYKLSSDIIPSPFYLSLPFTNLQTQGNMYFTDVTFDLCPYACANTPNCRGWTQDGEKGRGCWIKDATSGGEQRDTLDSFILANQPKRNYNIMNKVSFSGKGLTEFRGPNENCSLACDNLDGCTAYAVSSTENKSCKLQYALEGYQYAPTVDTFSIIS